MPQRVAWFPCVSAAGLPHPRAQLAACAIAVYSDSSPTPSHPLPATLYDPLAGEGSYFDKYITRTLAMTPEERAVALEEDDEVGVAGYGCPCPPPCC